MPSLILIAAIGRNLELGKENQLIWYLPNDLKFFKEHTTGHSIIMGYNTFLSVTTKKDKEGKTITKLLPNRKHIVLTHRDIPFPEGVEVYHDKASLLASLKEEEYYVIGGASIYEQFIEDASTLLLTEIDAEDEKADAYFPHFEKEDYEVTMIGEYKEEPIPYKHLEYRRKNNEKR